MAHKFRNLRVWQRSMSFVTEVYQLTQVFPKHELFGLTSQLRRAALSIPLNIAEGSGGNSSKEFARFLSIALKSTYETMTAIELSQRLGYSQQIQCEPLLDEADQIAAMITGLSKSIQNKHRTIYEAEAEYLTNSSQ